MKTITSLLIGCALAFTGAVMAQEPQAQESPAKQGGHQKTTTQPQGATETKPQSSGGETRGGKHGKGASNANQPTSTSETGPAQQGVGKHHPQGKAQEASAGAESSPGATEMNAGETGKKGKHGHNATTAETGANAGASPGASASMETGKKGKHGKGETAHAAASPAMGATGATGSAPNMSPATARTSPIASPGATGMAGATGATGTNSTATNTTAGAGNLKGQGTVGRGGKRVEQNQVQQIKQQHASFKAQPKPNVAPAVTFNQNYRISGAESWQGPQYEVFRSYHPEWHDRNWYHSHYGQVALIAGGYYFLNNGYWYPAWGYDQGAQYYAYDGPIYVGHRAEPPDRVIADVQAELQAMGYYTGEVDGLLGPLTRQALRDYQADHGLMVTETIDEPTLSELQLS